MGMTFDEIVKNITQEKEIEELRQQLDGFWRTDELLVEAYEKIECLKKENKKLRKKIKKYKKEQKRLYFKTIPDLINSSHKKKWMHKHGAI